MKKLIVVEKPKVASTFATILNLTKKNVSKENYYFENDRYIVTYSYGHLYRLKDMAEYDAEKYGTWKVENYPFIPELNQFAYVPNDQGMGSKSSGAAAQIELINNLIKRDDVECYINGCDDDREGESIGANIYRMSGSNKKAYRILYKAVTYEDVMSALKNPVPFDNRKTYIDGANARAITDWLVGINFTSMATLKMSERKVVNIGRVILPTLKFVYDRDMEIANFVPSKFYQVITEIAFENGLKINALYNSDDNVTKFEKDAATEIMKHCKGKQIEINVDDKNSKKSPHKLFNLTSFTSYILKQYDMFNGKDVLKIYQGLYEDGYLSYPRTASQYLAETEIEQFRKVYQIHAENMGLLEKSEFHTRKSVFDQEKVDSHSALTPTAKIPDFESLNDKEKIIYSEVRRLFMAQFMDAAVYQNILIECNIDGYKFYGETKLLIERGYLELFDVKVYPRIDIKALRYNSNLFLHEGDKSKPSPLTPSELIRLMETAGRNIDDSDETLELEILSGFQVGTQATIPDMADHLIDLGYIKKKGKALTTTKTGINLVERFPNKRLFDPIFTGNMQKLIGDIESNKMSLDSYYIGLKQFIAETVNILKTYEGEKIIELEELGACPICSGTILENIKTYNCSEKECKFLLYKNDSLLRFMTQAGKAPITLKPNDVKRLLKDGKFKAKLFSAKQGKEFEAYLGYDSEKNQIAFIEHTENVGNCPKCSGEVIGDINKYKCSKVNCNFVLYVNDSFLKNMSQKGKAPKTLKASDVKKLLKDGKFKAKLYSSKNDKEFEAFLGYDFERNGLKILEFVKANASK